MAESYMIYLALFNADPALTIKAQRLAVKMARRLGLEDKYLLIPDLLTPAIREQTFRNLTQNSL